MPLGYPGDDPLEWTPKIDATHVQPILEPEPNDGRSCSCLTELKKKLTKYHGEKSDVQLALQATINFANGYLGYDLPPLGYSYRVGKKKKYAVLKFSYCPFCGKKLV